jgi:hypothetical protein
VKRRGADTVFVCSGGVSGQITLPLPWTDRVSRRWRAGCRLIGSPGSTR